MPSAITPASVLRDVPGWEGALASELHGGLSNRSYKVTAGGRSGVLKIDDAPRRAPFNTRAAEARIQTAAADAGLAARVLYSDERVYLTEFLEGEVWQRQSLDVSGNLKKLAAGLERIHALPLTGRTFDALDAARRYAQISCEVDPKLTHYCSETIAAVGKPVDLRCCHNDLVVENVIDMSETKFLDWEFACDNDPLFDLATVVEHHQLSGEQTGALLSAYAATGETLSTDQFDRQRKLYLALLWLWMAARRNTDSDELERVAERLMAAGHS